MAITKKATVPRSDSRPAEDEEEHSFLKNARDLGFVLAIYLYLMGWVYVYYYLKDFGISIRQIDVDFYNLITYSIDVIRYLLSAIQNNIFKHWGYEIIIIVVVAICFVADRYLKKTSLLKKVIKSKRSITIVKYIVLILSFGAVYRVAMHAAIYNNNKDQIKGFTKLDTIRFEFKEDKTNIVIGTPAVINGPEKNDSRTFADLLKYNNAGELRLLIADKETYCVFRFDPTVTWLDVGSVPYEVYLIQREDIKFAKITSLL